jgi:4-hydroxy-3-methylbut-2-en-1-yl diphosphate synthase IspG/GcpE
MPSCSTGSGLLLKRHSWAALKIKAMKCPMCGKEDQVIPIQYGEPTAKAYEEEREGQLILGGCIVTGVSPDWYCKRDDLEF